VTSLRKERLRSGSREGIQRLLEIIQEGAEHLAEKSFLDAQQQSAILSQVGDAVQRIKHWVSTEGNNS
jgi:hypothetical protein